MNDGRQGPSSEGVRRVGVGSVEGGCGGRGGERGSDRLKSCFRLVSELEREKMKKKKKSHKEQTVKL